MGQYAGAWSHITTDTWVLQTIQHGYRIEFTHSPPLLGVKKTTPTPSEPELADLLRVELSKLQAKGAVAELDALPRGFFMSTYFLAPKKGGKWRPILNLRPLNRSVRPTHFRMETLHTILPLLQVGWWATSVDLTDAYLHIPVHPNDRKFLTFELEGKAYAFQALPFGLSTAPRVFTRVARVFGAHLRRLGIRVYMYLDDWLIVARDHQSAVRDTARVVQEALAFGWIINWEKSSLTPSQSPTYLGAVLDFRAGRARPTPERIMAVHEGARLLLASQVSTARAWLVFLGYLASLVDIVPWCRFHMRDLQFHLLKFFVPVLRDLFTPVPLSAEAMSAIRWWMDPLHLEGGMPFTEPPESAILVTDASLSGWGAHLGSRQVAGQWAGTWRHCHINLLELEAVRRAVLFFAPHIRHRGVLLRTDNTTVVAYVNRQGGTRSAPLWHLTKSLLTWCRANHVSLRAIHLPGKENTIADLLSRLSDCPTEWSLLPEVAQKIWLRYGQPNVDLFASLQNHKLRIFCALTPHPSVWRVDAFTCDWQDLVAYAFPPFALVPRVLQKLRTDGCRALLLVAPLWPGQPWFPTLLQYLSDQPRLLPVRTDIVQMPGSGRFHHNPATLHLTVWPLSANPLLIRAFRRKLRTSQPTFGGNLQWLCIRDVSESMPSGAPIERFLRLLPL